MSLKFWRRKSDAHDTPPPRDTHFGNRYDLVVVFMVLVVVLVVVMRIMRRSA